MTHSVIDIRNLSVAYQMYAQPSDQLKELIFGGVRHDTFWALRDVSFSVAEGERVGIVGPNGAGKSTLLQTIAGAITPTAGSLAVNGEISSLLSLVPAWNLDDSGIQNIEFNLMMRGVDPKKIEDLKADIIEFTDLGPYIYNPVKTYSSGMSARLSFAIATAIEPDILIIDEVLGTGDGYFAGRAAKRLQQMCQKGRALLFVSHATSAVRMMCDRCVWIENGVVRLDGPTEFVLRRYEEDMLRQDEATTREGNRKRLEKQISYVSADDLEDTSIWRLRIRPAHGGRFTDTHYVKDILIEVDGETSQIPLETKGRSVDGGSAFLDTQSCEWGRIIERSGVECRMLAARASMRPGGHILVKRPAMPRPGGTPFSVRFSEASLLRTEPLVVELMDVATGLWQPLVTSPSAKVRDGWTTWQAAAELPAAPGLDIEVVRERVALALRKPIEIASVSVLVDGKPAASMKELTPFEIAIELDHHEVVPSVNVSINIVRSDGVYVFYQPSGLNDRNIERHDGRSRVVFCFDENPFGYGDYEVNVFATDGFSWDNCPPQDIFDRALSQAKFRVDLARPIAFGLVNTLAKVDVISEPRRVQQPEASVELTPVPFPPPFKKMVAINSDVEWTSWKAQIDLLHIFTERKLETAFSYWFFGDPLVTWRLFDVDGTPSEHFERAKQLIEAGLLDTCHSYGGIGNGRGTPFGRPEILKSLATFSDAGLTFDVYSNHGGTEDVQNVGGPWCQPASNPPGHLNYQGGDLVGSGSYHLDATRDLAKFFWLDVDIGGDHLFSLSHEPDNQGGLLATQVSRDGTPLVRFRRSHLGCAPFPDALGEQIRRLLAAEGEGYQVIYTHLGCRGGPELKERVNKAPYFTPDAFEALDNLATAQAKGEVLVTTTSRLLRHAWLHVSRPWTIARDGTRLQVTFASVARWGGVEMPLRWSDLDGFAIPAEGLSGATLTIGEESREADIWTVGNQTYIGRRWSNIDMNAALAGIDA